MAYAVWTIYVRTRPDHIETPTCPLTEPWPMQCVGPDDDAEFVTSAMVEVRVRVRVRVRVWVRLSVVCDMCNGGG